MVDQSKGQAKIMEMQRNIVLDRSSELDVVMEERLETEGMKELQLRCVA